MAEILNIQVPSHCVRSSNDSSDSSTDENSSRLRELVPYVVHYDESGFHSRINRAKAQKGPEAVLKTGLPDLNPLQLDHDIFEGRITYPKRGFTRESVDTGIFKNYDPSSLLSYLDDLSSDLRAEVEERFSRQLFADLHVAYRFLFQKELIGAPFEDLIGDSDRLFEESLYMGNPDEKDCCESKDLLRQFHTFFQFPKKAGKKKVLPVAVQASYFFLFAASREQMKIRDDSGRLYVPTLGSEPWRRIQKFFSVDTTAEFFLSAVTELSLAKLRFRAFQRFEGFFDQSFHERELRRVVSNGLYAAKSSLMNILRSGNEALPFRIVAGKQKTEVYGKDVEVLQRHRTGRVSLHANEPLADFIFSSGYKIVVNGVGVPFQRIRYLQIGDVELVPVFKFRGICWITRRLSLVPFKREPLRAFERKDPLPFTEDIRKGNFFLRRDLFGSECRYRFQESIERSRLFSDCMAAIVLWGERVAAKLSSEYFQSGDRCCCSEKHETADSMEGIVTERGCNDKLSQLMVRLWRNGVSPFPDLRQPISTYRWEIKETKRIQTWIKSVGIAPEKREDLFKALKDLARSSEWQLSCMPVRQVLHKKRRELNPSQTYGFLCRIFPLPGDIIWSLLGFVYPGDRLSFFLPSRRIEDRFRSLLTNQRFFELERSWGGRMIVDTVGSRFYNFELGLPSKAPFNEWEVLDNLYQESPKPRFTSFGSTYWIPSGENRYRIFRNDYRGRQKRPRLCLGDDPPRPRRTAEARFQWRDLRFPGCDLAHDCRCPRCRIDY